MLKTEIIEFGTSPDPRFIAEWIELCEEGPCNDPFLRPEWFMAFVPGLEAGVRLITVRRNDKLRAVLPLMSGKTSLHGLRINALSAVYDLNTPRYGLVHGGDDAERREIADALWNALTKSGEWDVLEARLVDTDDWFRDLLERSKTDGSSVGVWQMDPAPYIALPSRENGEQEIDAFFKGSRKHLGKELDRRLRRLRESGSVEFRVSREYSPELIDRYLTLESLGWKGRRGTAAVQHERSSRLHHDFARAVATAGAFYSYELVLDGRTIAMSLNVGLDTTMYHWRTSYDESFSKFAPGNLLFRRLLLDCVDDGVEKIDFLSPSSPYKRTWATGEREHVAYYVFRPSLLGRLARVWKFAVISRLRTFKARYPAFVGRLPI